MRKKSGFQTSKYFLQISEIKCAGVSNLISFDRSVEFLKEDKSEMFHNFVNMFHLFQEINDKNDYLTSKLKINM